MTVGIAAIVVVADAAQLMQPKVGDFQYEPRIDNTVGRLEIAVRSDVGGM